MMQVKYKTYEKYKDSGVPWIGDIPNGWDVKKLKYLLEKHQAGSWGEEAKGDKNDIVCIRVADFDYERLMCDDSNLTHRNITNPNIINENTLLIEKSGGGDKTPVGRVVNYNLKYKATTSNFIEALYPKNIDVSFLNYALATIYYRGINFFHIKQTTGIQNLDLNSYLSERVPLPPRDQQNCIAEFLDQKTAEIDAAIKNKERLVELLKEQKDIIINDAVTKGLNPKVKMKESGIEWIEKIPEHWEIKRAKYLFNEIDERSNDGSEELLSVSHTTGVTPRSDKNVNMFMSEDYSGSKLCKKGDVVFNIMWAWMGALGVSNHEGIVSPSYGVYRPKKKNVFNNWYLEQLLRSSKYVEEYNKRSTGLHSSRLRLYSHMFFAMEIGFPSIDEQNIIEKEVKIKCVVSDDMLATTKLEIEKLKEFRKTLISHAVTGKIKI